MSDISQFLVDVWNCGLFDQIIDCLSTNDDLEDLNTSKNEMYSAYYNFLPKTFIENEKTLSLIGMKLWSDHHKSYFINNKTTTPINNTKLLENNEGSSKDLDVNIEVLTNNINKRRANYYTPHGRPTVNKLYDELIKGKLDEHYLISPYLYGELLGPAEKLSQPYRIIVHPQVGLICDIHSHLSNAEVIGLLAGKWSKEDKCIYIQAAFPCTSTDRAHDYGHTDVELDPEAEWKVREMINSLGLQVVGWYHSHPKFKPDPSLTDIFNQQQYQLYTRDEESDLEPFVGLIVSTYDPQLPSSASLHQWFTVIPYTPTSAIVATASAPSNLECLSPSSDMQQQYDPISENKVVTVTKPVIYIPMCMDVEYYSMDSEMIYNNTDIEYITEGFINDDDRYKIPLVNTLNSVVNSSLEANENKLKQQHQQQQQPISKISNIIQIEDEVLDEDEEVVVEVDSVSGSHSTLIHYDQPEEELRINVPIDSNDTAIVINEVINDNNCTELKDDGTIVVLTKKESNVAEDEVAIIEENIIDIAEEDVTAVVDADDSIECIKKDQVMNSDTATTDVIDHNIIENYNIMDEINDSNQIILDPSLEHNTINPDNLDATCLYNLLLDDNTRKSGRNAKKREFHGDFVDSLVALNGRNLRKEKLINGKLKSKIIKKKNIPSIVINNKNGVEIDVIDVKQIKKKKGIENKNNNILSVTTTNDQENTKNKKLNNKKMIKNKKELKNKKEMKLENNEIIPVLVLNKQTLYTSFVIALKDETKQSSKFARNILFSIVPHLRYIALSVISLGFYYSRSAQRIDLTKKWKGRSILDTIKYSSNVWINKLFVKSIMIANPEYIHMLQNYEINSKLIEMISEFLVLCWEDYNKPNMKKK